MTFEILIKIFAIFAFIAIFALLIRLAIIDIREYILPNRLVLALFISFLCFHASQSFQLLSLREIFIGALVGGLFLGVIRIAAIKIMKQEAMGMGDVKFMAAAGAGLGMPAILLALTFGSFMGILHGVYLQKCEERKTGHKVNLGTINVPAGAGLSVGVAVIFLYTFGISWAF